MRGLHASHKKNKVYLSTRLTRSPSLLEVHCLQVSQTAESRSEWAACGIANEEPVEEGWNGAEGMWLKK